MIATNIGTGASGALPAPQPFPTIAEDAESPKFDDIIKNLIADGLGKIKMAESNAVSGLNGTTSVQDVVSSILGAERVAFTAIAVRDKFVGALQEISRMQI
jgi:flagellar hook-basal body complex protein FliE